MSKANLGNDKWFLKAVKNKRIKVTKDGKITNLETGKPIGSTDSRGYRKIALYDKDEKKIYQIQVHRLVWLVFKGPIKDPTLVVNHKDLDRSNCALSNLELITIGANNEHGRQMKKKGVKTAYSKESDIALRW